MLRSRGFDSWECDLKDIKDIWEQARCGGN